MTLEVTLERIAVALEALAAANNQPFTPKAQTPAAAAKKSAAKPEPVPELIPEDIIPPAKTAAKPVAPAAVPPTFEKVQKRFYEMLTCIRDKRGLFKAREIAASVLGHFTEGAPLSEKSLAPENYQAFLDHVEVTIAEYQ